MKGEALRTRGVAPAAEAPGTFLQYFQATFLRPVALFISLRLNTGGKTGTLGGFLGEVHATAMLATTRTLAGEERLDCS